MADARAQSGPSPVQSVRCERHIRLWCA